MDGQIDNSYFVLNNFYNNFMTFGSETALTGGVIKLFTIDQVQTFVNTTVQNYYNINSEYSLDYYDNLDRETGLIIPVQMYISNEPTLMSDRPMTNYT